MREWEEKTGFDVKGIKKLLEEVYGEVPEEVIEEGLREEALLEAELREAELLEEEVREAERLDDELFEEITDEIIEENIEAFMELAK